MSRSRRRPIFGGKPESRPGLGDRIEKIVKPIAKALKMKCLDEKNRLRAGSPCAKRRDAANRLGKVIGL